MQDHKLEVFCAVIEYESFSKAAEVKFLTQSAISHLIKGLEQNLGTRLIYRHTRTIKPTAAGMIFYECAKKILSGYKKLNEDIHELLHEVKGPLHIGADTTATNFLLPQLLYQFKLTYPHVITYIAIRNPEKMAWDLKNAKVDFIITQETLPEKFVFEEELVEDEVVLVGPENHSLAEKNLIIPTELYDHPFVMVSYGNERTEFTDLFFNQIGIDPKLLKVVMVTDSQNLAIKMVKYGIGLAVVSKWAVFRDVQKGAAIILKVGKEHLPSKFKLIRLEKIPITAAARAFLKFTENFSFFVPF